MFQIFHFRFRSDLVDIWRGVEGETQILGTDILGKCLAWLDEA